MLINNKAVYIKVKVKIGESTAKTLLERKENFANYSLLPSRS